jgi:hypothetical protein
MITPSLQDGWDSGQRCRLAVMGVDGITLSNMHASQRIRSVYKELLIFLKTDIKNALFLCKIFRRLSLTISVVTGDCLLLLMY